MKKNPLQPHVTMEQVIAYDPKKPETRTASRVVNAVMEAMHEVGADSAERICRYLEVDEKDLNGALMIEMGVKLSVLRHVYLKYLYTRMLLEHPDWNSDMIAEAMGFGSRSTLWRLFNQPPRRRQKK